MKIRLDDPTLVSDLLTFLRTQGCIAYLTDDLNAIEVIRAHDFGDDEEREITALLLTWRGDHPGVAVDVVP